MPSTGERISRSWAFTRRSSTTRRIPDAIAAAAEDLGVTWPIALDTARQSFRSWQGSPAYWPRTYVLDREGHIRFDHIGEGAYEELNETVAVLLG